jgi:putative drug exporter of the RND superfamily
MKIHWLVMMFSVIILLAVGSDYNLLLVSRIRDEIHAGLKTGMIRSMGGTGEVVTSAGLVFAVTMASMLGSSLITVAQFGSTIAVGLLLDTLIVRTLLMPSIATLLGRWFWWPLRVRTHAVRPPVAHAAGVQGSATDRDAVTTQPLVLGTTSYDGQR